MCSSDSLKIDLRVPIRIDHDDGGGFCQVDTQPAGSGGYKKDFISYDGNQKRTEGDATDLRESSCWN